MPHTLLLADDSITIQRVIELTFADQDVRVVSAADGQQAIERLAEMRPDVILADIAMPKLDGYEVARHVRSQPELREVPVILLSGAFEPVDEARLRECGAAGVLVKPFEPNVVISRVKELLGLSSPAPASPAGSRLVTSAGGPSPASKSAAPPQPPAPESWDQLRQEQGLGEAGPVESADTPQADDYLDSLDDAFDTLDAKLAGRGGPKARAGAAKVAQRLPAALDPVARARQRAAESAAAPPAAPAAPQPSAPRADGPPVFEVDEGWFESGAKGSHVEDLGQAAQDIFEDEILLTPEVVAAAIAAEQTPPETRTVPPSAPPPSAPAAPPPAAAPPGTVHDVADAFEALLAAEQGEVQPGAVETPQGAPGQVPPASVELSDAMIDRIAARVVERLAAGYLQGVISNAVRDVVGGVSERLVREEIDRIRNS